MHWRTKEKLRAALEVVAGLKDVGNFSASDFESLGWDVDELRRSGWPSPREIRERAVGAVLDILDDLT